MRSKYILCKIIILLHSFSFLAQNNPIPTIEYQALVDFYNTMGGDSWANKWDISSNDLHLNDWYGVSIENEHVVEINLRSNGLIGAIPTSFSNLKYLKKLDLGYGPPYRSNDLSTTDLNNLSGLENLEELILYNCKIVGNIPNSWGQLTKLKTLNLSDNEFEGAIFDGIGNLTALETIDFSRNNISSIPPSIGNLVSLETLNLRDNTLKALPQALENLTNLSVLYVDSNEISDVLPLLDTSISLSINSQTLVLEEFTYTGEDVILTNLPKITRYDRSKNDFSATNTFNLRIDNTTVSSTLTMTSDGSVVIPKADLATITPEKQVSLYQRSGTAYNSYINFASTRVDLPGVPDSEYQALVDFYTAMGGESWAYISWDVSTNNLNEGAWDGLVIEDGHITEINLKGNRLVGAIPASISDLAYLKKLDLGYGSPYRYQNDLSTTDLNNLSGLENLEELNLYYCQLTGATPSSWGQLTKLKTLNVSDNDLEGAIFEGIGNLSALETIDFSSNSFTAIPEEIGNLTALETIDFSRNNISSIPPSIGNLVSLETLNLRDNTLKALPQALENLTNLSVLYVDSNEISDVLPLLDTSISLSINSQTLVLEEFTYTGEDVILTNLPKITRYDRSKNDFSATNTFNLRIDNTTVSSTLTMTSDGSVVIPKADLATITPEKQVSLYQRSGTAIYSYINFASTRVDLPAVPDSEYQALVDFYTAMGGESWAYISWDVSTNNLSEGAWDGLVIEDGHITEINLKGNRLVGAIPASISDLAYLKKLDLGYVWPYFTAQNDLSTTDLNNLSGLENLEELNLNRCQLTGTTPSSWGQLTKLKTLNVSDNDLEGAIFEGIGNLSALETIDFSSNSFTAIPEEIGNLTALETIDFSRNNISSIPPSIGNLVSLETLNLRDNTLKALPQALENLTNLSVLYVDSNEISDVLPLLDTSISLSINSQTLVLEEFTYTGEDVILTNLPKITRYDRSKNDFSATNTFNLRIDNTTVSSTLTMTSDGSVVIPKADLATITPEKQVSLYQRSGTAIYSYINFASTRVDLPAVPDSEYQALVDFYTAMGGESWAYISWDVSTNNLSEGAWDGLVIEDGHITEINLKGNRLVGAIPASISDLAYLKKLDLGYVWPYFTAQNDLSTTDLNNLSGLENLEELNLNRCQLTGTTPSSWGQLTKLKTLNISQNEFEGAIFDGIGNLTALETIDFSSNSFTAIPPEMGNLIALTSLNLSNNALESSATNFSELLMLTSFNLRYQEINVDSIEIGANEITFVLPNYFEFEFIDGKIKDGANNEFQLYVNGSYKKTAFSNSGALVFSNINVLNLQATDKLRLYQVNAASAYSNIYYDTITFGAPLVDEEFEILKKIYESTNGDTWTNRWDTTENNLNIESWYGVSIKEGHVISINLSNNNLSGILPEDINGLQFLKTLSLDNNSIEGIIPKDIYRLTELEILDLSSNRLSGEIPERIAELQKLEKFTIENNDFRGSIASVLSDFLALEYLDLSNNSFDKVEKKLYYDFTNTYIDLRNQVIDYNIVLNVEGNSLKVDLENIAYYDLENNDFEAKNTFTLLVDNVIHTTTSTNDSDDIIFDNVRIGEIPADAKISIQQTTGTFRNTVFNFTGIEDKSNIPVIEAEYLALVEFYTQLNGTQWINTWDVSSNNIHINKWYGVSTYDGHIVAIDLESNNLSGSIPDVFSSLPFLNTLDVSSNSITGIAQPLLPEINFIYDRQLVNNGTKDLNRDALVVDNRLNRYEHDRQSFNNQTYNITIGDFSKTINIPEEGIKLIDLIKIWEVTDNQILELRQVSGNAANSIINYNLTYLPGDSNLDSNLNILDLQTSINHIVDNPIIYLNFNAADLNNDQSIDILDLVNQVNIIQNQESILTRNINTSEGSEVHTVKANITLESGKLILDTNGHNVTSFQITIDNTSKDAVLELISNLGFSVDIKNTNGKVSMLAYTFGTALNGIIELAEITSENPKVDALILSDMNAVEIETEIIDQVLSIETLEKDKLLQAYNYPNPFKEESSIHFFANTESRNTVLELYDLSGKKCKTINLGTLSTGKSSYLFKRKTLASGLYFYFISSQGVGIIAKGKMTIK